MKSKLFIIAMVTTPIIFFSWLCIYMYNYNKEITPEKSLTSRPMSVLSDMELDQIIGQAGIEFVNENFNFNFNPNNCTTVQDFQTQLSNYMVNLQQTDPQEAMVAYANIIKISNAPDSISNGNIIPGQCSYVTINMQHAMDQIITDGIEFMSTSVNQLKLGNFGIYGLEVNAPGKIHVFVRE